MNAESYPYFASALCISRICYCPQLLTFWYCLKYDNWIAAFGIRTLILSYSLANKTHTHAHTRARARMHTHTHSRARAHTHARTYTRAHTHTHTHTHIYIYISLRTFCNSKDIYIYLLL